jgi:hypothetical protein
VLEKSKSGVYSQFEVQRAFRFNCSSNISSRTASFGRSARSCAPWFSTGN